jgi:hypothetical protein
MKVKKRDKVKFRLREGKVIRFFSAGMIALVKWDGEIGDHCPPYRRTRERVDDLIVVGRRNLSKQEFKELCQ